MKEHFKIFPLLSRYSNLKRRLILDERLSRDTPEELLAEFRQLDEQIMELDPEWGKSDSGPSRTPQGVEEA